ncbi:MAG: hypothetical protein QW697_01890 [Acidilobaceae archaeon]
MDSALNPEHGSIVLSRDGLIAQVIGIPRPPGMVPVIPKYRLCEGSLWSRSGVHLCRVIEMYGPRGLSDSIARYGFREAIDGIYSSPIPYIRLSDIVELIRPREAFERVTRRPANTLHYKLIEIAYMLIENGLNHEELGLTGSIAFGSDNPAVSDIDLIVYGSRASRVMYRVFAELTPEKEKNILSDFGGLTINPPLDITWRRRTIMRVQVAWTGIPLVGDLCKPLREYYNIPSPWKPIRLSVEVEARQETSLLYPPCAKTRDGLYIVSFEYNIAPILYNGGLLEISGLESIDGSVIYLATRQYPGSITFYSISPILSK